jgi:hypothetical protein
VSSVPDPLLLRKSGSAGNRTRTDHYTIEAVGIHVHRCKNNPKDTSQVYMKKKNPYCSALLQNYAASLKVTGFSPD